MIEYTAEQLAVATAEGRRFLTGPAGAGKTTAAVARLRHLLMEGVPGHEILVLLPQRTLGRPYVEALRDRHLPPGGEVSLLTMGGLARRMVDLFWPLVAEEAGFAHPEAPPRFLTMETAQYFLARVVEPLREREGFFDAVTIRPQRIYAQLLDALNKAALNGYPHTEIGERLLSAWVGEAAQETVYRQVQAAVEAFRAYCLEHNLLDFSLQMELLHRHLWPQPLFRDYLFRRYRHLIADNVEEETPLTHDLLRDWLPRLDSALLIYDEGGGHRLFLGADAQGGRELAALCEEEVRFAEPRNPSPPVLALTEALGRALDAPPLGMEAEADFRPALHRPEQTPHYYPQMLDWVAEQVAELVDRGVPPSEIVILAPFLNDLLRFSLLDRLKTRHIPARTHRPSRSLREEPAVQALLTLAQLAHPQWGMQPRRADVALMLRRAIEEMDLVRARLLTEVRYRRGALLDFDGITNEETKARITYRLGERYQSLVLWLEDYRRRGESQLDRFFQAIFHELLAHEGFGFYRDYDAAYVAAMLIESAQKFYRVVGEIPSDIPWGKEYLTMVEAGVVAAQYLLPWTATPAEAVLIAPAYTFLMTNRAVDYQFWLDVGGRGWWERLYQPLTHPYVLSRRWEIGRPWTDAEEVASRRESLARLTRGLLLRCRRGLYLGLSRLNARGYEESGPLLVAFQRVLRG